MVRSFPASHATAAFTRYQYPSRDPGMSSITNLAGDGLNRFKQSAHDALLTSTAARRTFPTVEAIWMLPLWKS